MVLNDDLSPSLIHLPVQAAPRQGNGKPGHGRWQSMCQLEDALSLEGWPTLCGLTGDVWLLDGLIAERLDFGSHVCLVCLAVNTERQRGVVESCGRQRRSRAPLSEVLHTLAAAHA